MVQVGRRVAGPVRVADDELVVALDVDALEVGEEARGAQLHRVSTGDLRRRTG